MLDDSPILQRKNEAKEWFFAGQIDCAVTIWQDLRSTAPETAMARANLGIVNEKRGQLHAGLREFTIALRLDSCLGAAWQAADDPDLQKSFIDQTH